MKNEKLQLLLIRHILISFILLATNIIEPPNSNETSGTVGLAEPDTNQPSTSSQNEMVMPSNQTTVITNNITNNANSNNNSNDNNPVADGKCCCVINKLLVLHLSKKKEKNSFSNILFHKYRQHYID